MDGFTVTIIDGLITHHRLDFHRETIHQLIKPAIQLLSKRTTEDKLGLGTSKLGGLPDLPPHFKWPTCKSNPLAFVAQINLAEIPSDLARNNLPLTGILYFFSLLAWRTEADNDEHPQLPWHDYKEPDFSQVLYLEKPSVPLVRCVKPSGFKTFAPAEIQFILRPSLPHARSYVRDVGLEHIPWPEDELNRLDDLYDAFNQFWKTVAPHRRCHQLMGYAGTFQKATPQPLLFQLDSDFEEADMIWEDGGRILFTLSESALLARDFSQAQGQLESG